MNYLKTYKIAQGDQKAFNKKKKKKINEFLILRGSVNLFLFPKKKFFSCLLLFLYSPPKQKRYKNF